MFDDVTPVVEGLSIDEAFLDVSGLRRVSGTPRAIAERLRRDVLARVGLAITVGVARTKFLAKVASGVAKPDGLLVVPPEGELDGRAVIHDQWLVGAAAFGTGNTRLTVGVVDDVDGNGVFDDAPDVVPDADGDGDVDKFDLADLGVASNIVSVPFSINGAPA